MTPIQDNHIDGGYEDNNFPCVEGGLWLGVKWISLLDKIKDKVNSKIHWTGLLGIWSTLRIKPFWNLKNQEI
jgi:hypothetical protein